MQEFLMDLLFCSESMHNKIKHNEIYRRIADEGEALYKKICNSLSDGLKSDFMAYADALSGMQCNSSETYFKEGLKFGVKLVIECLSN